MPFGGTWFLIRICFDCVPKTLGTRSRFRKFGAGDRIRTGDIDLGKVALYQLSYSRISQAAGPIVAPQTWIVKFVSRALKRDIHKMFCVWVVCLYPIENKCFKKSKVRSC